MGIQRCRHQSDVEDTVTPAAFCVKTCVRNRSLSLASPEDLICLICTLHLHLGHIIDKHQILSVTFEILGGRDPAGGGAHTYMYIYTNKVACTYVMCGELHLEHAGRKASFTVMYVGMSEKK